MHEEKMRSMLRYMGSRLRNLRAKQGETMAIHEKISKKYNIRLKQSYYSKLERGLVSPPLRTLYALADYFDVNINSLLDPSFLDQGNHSLQVLLQRTELINLMEEFTKLLDVDKAEYYLTSTLRKYIELLKEEKTRKKYGDIFKAAKKR